MFKILVKLFEISCENYSIRHFAGIKTLDILCLRKFTTLVKLKTEFLQ